MEEEVMSEAIVVTTIFSPSKAVAQFAALPRRTVFVAGDKKTPADWACRGARFISLSMQQESQFETLRMAPVNHYARKMAGYLYAMLEGCDAIVDTDDDNAPKEAWGFPPGCGSFDEVSTTSPFVNVYSYFTKARIWPRGFPINLISRKETRVSNLVRKEVRVGIWQGLADGDPDVDAIYRLTDNSPCYFDDRPPIVLPVGCVCPFNSQNTLFAGGEVYPLLYLPAFVSFRFTDILRGLVAQPILWSRQLRLGFTAATVVQVRNEHDYLKDFESEVPCYLFAEKIVEWVRAKVSSTLSVSENLMAAYEELHRHGVVKTQELRLLAAWLKDVAQLQSKA
jgi:hypothetical protein